MWWIIGAIVIFSVLLAMALCKVSGDCSRKEEELARHMAEKQESEEESEEESE